MEDISTTAGVHQRVGDYPTQEELDELGWWLNEARESSTQMDVSTCVESAIRDWIMSFFPNKMASILYDLGTSSNELNRLLKEGYKAEALGNLENARELGANKDSFFSLYQSRCKDAFLVFWDNPGMMSFEYMLSRIFIFNPEKERRDSAALAREYLKKAGLDPQDIGTSEEELSGLEQ